MKKIQGYVCVAKVVGLPEVDCVLFGKKLHKTDGFYESLHTNNLTPYDSLRNARRGQKDLLGVMYVHRVDIRKLEMRVAETKEELFTLEKEKSLVVVWKNEFSTHLLGRRVEGLPGVYPLSGAYIERNGLKPFQQFDIANYARSEASRQSDNSPATLATFKISKHNYN